MELNNDFIAGMKYVKAKKRAERLDTLRKWWKLIKYLITGCAFCGGVLAAYIGMILLVGTP